MEENTKESLKHAREYALQRIKDEVQALLELIPQLDENLKEAVDMMFNCKREIIVTGVGKSSSVGVKIVAILSPTSTSAFYINPLNTYHSDLSVTTPDDVVLVLSNSG